MLSLAMQIHNQLVARVKDEYPCLYNHVMADQRPNMSFLLVLGQRYKQSTVPMNLVTLMNEITEKYPYHLIWAQAPERYQIIINAIRGEQMDVAIDFEKMQHQITVAQNRILKSFSGLAALDQHER